MASATAVRWFSVFLLFLHCRFISGAAAGRSSAISASRRLLTSGTDSEDVLPEVREKEADFMAWVSRVGQKQVASQEEIQTSRDVWLNDNEASGVDRVITVGDGGQFSSIQAAVDSVRKKNTQRVIIQIAAGTYHEKVLIPKSKPYITLQGAGSGLTKITHGDTKADTGKTQDSATVSVTSEGFIAKGITFENSAPAPGPGAVGRQAVALRIAGDKAAFYECSFLGAQDTLYDDHGRHYFVNCYIQGSIDFIFGDGQSLYKGCSLHTLPINPGALTAQKRSSPGESTGFSFVNCNVGGSGALYLGRAWGPYSRVVFSHSYISNVIIPAGWLDWGISARQKTAFYGQYKCSGPGANEDGRVAWSHELSDAEAAPFQTISFIDGASWLPSWSS